MDNRTLLAVFLSVLVYYSWLSYIEAKQAAIDAENPVIEAQVDPEQKAKKAKKAKVKAKAKAKAQARKSDLPVRDVTFQACDAVAGVTTDGGYLRDLTLQNYDAAYQMQPLYTWVLGRLSGSVEGPWKPYGETPGKEVVLGSEGRALGIGSGAYDSAPPRYEVVEESANKLVLRGVTEDGIEVQTTLTQAEGEGPCLIEVDVQWTNTTEVSFDKGVWLGVHEPLAEGGSGGMFAMYQNQKTPMAVVDEDYVSYTNYDDLEAPDPQEGPVAWFGLADRYFGFVLLPAVGGGEKLAFSALGDAGSKIYGAHVRLDDALAPGATTQASYRLYVGPLKLDWLEHIHPELDNAVQLGWFALFAHVLIWLLTLFHAGVGNWGLSIVMLTLLVKLIFFPLTQTAFRSSQAMASLQPEMQRLREEYADNAEEMNRRMVELFRDNGVNPFGGCLPMIIQMPVWIALYRVLLSSVDLYHTEFLYLRDLSSIDPYLVLPTTVVALMLIQQQFMPTGNMDPAQARMMKLMPLFFGIFFFVFPSGLVIYIFINMLLSIAQQWFIKRTFTPAGVANQDAGS